MNSECGLRFMYRSQMQKTAIDKSLERIDKILGASSDLIGRKEWSKEKDLFLVRDISEWALEMKAQLSEAAK